MVLKKQLQIATKRLEDGVELDDDALEAVMGGGLFGCLATWVADKLGMAVMQGTASAAATGAGGVIVLAAVALVTVGFVADYVISETTDSDGLIDLIADQF